MIYYKNTIFPLVYDGILVKSKMAQYLLKIKNQKISTLHRRAAGSNNAV
jgi:hypothetical protein